MKFQKCGRLILAETAALGWFLLRRIPFTGVLLLLPLSLLFFFLPRPKKPIRWISYGLSGIAALIASRVTAFGFSEGGGWISLFLLLLAMAVFAPRMAENDWNKISNWWGIAFAAFFILLMMGSLPALQRIGSFPGLGNGWDLLIFLLLAIAEPFADGEESKGAPIVLSLMLIPFSFISYSVLGARGFQLLEYPYLSAWAGATVISFHHLEGIILSLYYGLAGFKLAAAGSSIRKNLAIKRKA